MTPRIIVFACVLALAAAAVTVGASIMHHAAGWVVGGVLAALWSWLILGDAS